MGLSRLRVFKLLLRVALVGIFIAMSRNEIMRYTEHPTATRNYLSTEEDISLPALTICDNHFRYGEMAEELDFPKVPFGPGITPNKIKIDPPYRQLVNLEINMTLFQWKYYFSVHEILHRCTAGGRKCNVKSEQPGVWNGSQLEFEVPVGKWISRSVTDALEGHFFMCHTLIPNVTVDFGTEDGNMLGLSWNPAFMEASSYWTIYVHDKHEHFLLSSYSMANLPKITISKPRVKGKKKIMLFPETRTAVNTPTNPCNSTREYSHNLCQLKACWKSRLLRVKERYRSLFQCQIPGIVIDPGEALPVCDHLIMAREEKTYLGILDLVNYSQLMLLNETRGKKPLNLVTPALGTELSRTNCIKRCQSTTYFLIPEEAEEKDPAMFLFDLYLYFPSAEVVHWDQYESYGILTLISNIGGMLGLLLGASIMTFLSGVLDTAKRISNLEFAK